MFALTLLRDRQNCNSRSISDARSFGSIVFGRKPSTILWILLDLSSSILLCKIITVWNRSITTNVCANCAQRKRGMKIFARKDRERKRKGVVYKKKIDRRRRSHEGVQKLSWLGIETPIRFEKWKENFKRMEKLNQIVFSENTESESNFNKN